MKKVLCLTLAAAMFASAATAEAADRKELKENLESHVAVHGFIRNYFAFDTRESVAGTGDLFYWVPKDENIVDGVDFNAQPQFRFLALTSRLWVDVNGYQIENTKIGARIEADFYAGLTNNVTGTAQFRLRQAYVTLGWEQENATETLKIGQAWHPMAADMPDVFSLNTGAPFGPFSRTPVAQLDANFGKTFGLTAAAIWQQQYPSAGPDGASASYIKYSCVPELYLGLNVTAGPFFGRAGVDVLSIKPRNKGVNAELKSVKVKDRITTVSPFIYAQVKTKIGKVPFTAKAKTIIAQDGSHLSLNGGYGVSSISTDGSYGYTPTRNSSTWVSLAFGSKFQGVLFGGYVKNFGTKDELMSIDGLYFSKNSFKNMNQMWRVTPTFMYNLGKFTLGLEYEITSIQYGKWDENFKHGLATKDLHWVTNNRLQAMVKFTF